MAICPVCLSESVHKVLRDLKNPGASGIYACPGCGLRFSYPRLPARENLRQYEELEDELYMRPDLRPADLYDGEIAGLEDCLGGAGRLLDVGAAGGLLLRSALRRGWSVQGVEVSRAFAQYAAQSLGLPVHHGDLASARLAAESFDAVVMSHVVEHLTDPALEIAESWRLLRPGGVLMVECPNFDCPFRPVLGLRWWFLLNGHINHFDRRSLSSLLGRNGFEVERVRFPAVSYSVEVLADRFATLYARRLGDWASRRIDGTALGRSKLKLKLWDVIRIYARKPARAASLAGLPGAA